MHVIHHHVDIPANHKGAVIAIGNFDGVHRGHQGVVSRAASLADEMNVPLGVLLFEPHPREFFQPDSPNFRLMQLRDKVHMLGRLGVDVIYALKFDSTMANMSAQDFVMDVLVEGLAAVHVIVGYDYAFGKGRTGDVTVLSWMAEMEGFGLTVVEPMALDAPNGEGSGEVFSSTRIRDHLAGGRPRQAADLLGHWWSINGPVLPGDQRGRTIGFPTANISLEPYLVPKLGVYAVQAHLEDPDADGASRRSQIKTIDGVANIGRRPTFDKEDVLLEVHLFDFNEDIYGRHLRVSFIDFIRPELKFDGIDALKAQIALDCEKARELLRDARPTLGAYEEGLDAIVGHTRQGSDA